MTDELKNENSARQKAQPVAISVQGGGNNLIQGNITIGYENAINVTNSPETKVRNYNV